MNYAFGALWGACVLFWLAFARGNKRTATPVGLRWRFTALAAILVVLLGSRQFPEYFRHPLRPPRAAWAYIGLALTAGGLGFTMWARRALGTIWSTFPGLRRTMNSSSAARTGCAPSDLHRPTSRDLRHVPRGRPRVEPAWS